MSLLTKVFVCLSLIASLLFVGVAGAVVAKQENFKKRYMFELVARQRDQRTQERLQSQLAAVMETKRRKIFRQREYLIAWARENQRSQEYRDAMVDLFGNVSEKIQRFTGITVEFEEIMQSYERSLRDLMSRAQQLAQMKNEVEEERATMWLELARAQATVGRLREELNVLDYELYRVTQEIRQRRQLIALYREADPVNSVAGLEGPLHPTGFVVAVDADTQVVVINIGANEDVQPHQIFSVIDEDQFCGHIEIIEVYEMQAAGRILPEFTARPIKVGNQVRPRAAFSSAMPRQGR